MWDIIRALAASSFDVSSAIVDEVDFHKIELGMNDWACQYEDIRKLVMKRMTEDEGCKL